MAFCSQVGRGDRHRPGIFFYGGSMTDRELKQLQAEFEAECGPLLLAVAERMGAMIGRREVVKLAMFNEGLKSLATHAAEQLRELDKEQPAGPGAGARLIPGCKPYFFDN